MAQSEPSEAYLRTLTSTRQRFVATLSTRLDNIVAQVDAERRACDREAPARKLHRLLHDLAGNAAMLELPDVEAAVRRGLTVAERADRGDRRLSPEEQAELFEAVTEARKLADALARGLPSA